MPLGRFLIAVIAAFAFAVHAAELRLGMSADVTSIDPHQINVAPNNAVGWHIYDALTHVDADARLVPGLALAWRALDATTWEFKLRRNVKFHDGSAFTADDVAFSIDRANELGKSGGQYASFVKPIVSKQVVDAHTIRFKTATAYAMLPYDLNSIFIVSKKAAGASTQDFNSGSAAIGTGPFKLARFARGDRVDLTANAGYWGGKPPWEQVTLRILPDDKSRIAALLAGDVDAIENVPTADAVRLKGNSALRLEQKVSWRTLFFHMDQYRDSAPGVSDKAGRPLGKNPFKDARVREAISKAINRQAIVERVMEGLALPASNLVAPPVFGYNAAIKTVPYDIEGAKRLLAAAGYGDGFALTLAAPNNRYVNDDQIAQAAAQMLSRVGIRIRVETLPAAAYFSKARNGEFGFSLLGWGSFSADLALRALVATPNPATGFGTWNWGHYSNPRLDQLVERGLATVDETQRARLAEQAMALAMQDFSVIPLHHQIASWAMKKGLAYSARTDEYTFAHHFPSAIAMLVFIVRRLMQSVLVLYFMSLLVFVGVYAIGNPVDILINPQADQADIERAIAALGLDKPIWEQYLVFLRQALGGDLGKSFAYNIPAIQLILERMPATLELALAATALAVGLGIPFGLWAGLKPESWAGRLIMTGSILGFSLPTFWVGLMLIMVFAVELGWLPSNGRGPTSDLFGVPVSFLSWEGLRHLILPTVNLALFKLSLIIRLTRAGTREALLQDYVKFARAKGLSNARVVGVHVLKNILIPIVTVIGLEFGSVIAFAIVTESIFAWPGMGKLIIDSINVLDRPVIVAYLLIIVTLFILINLAVDIVYSLLDPRVRLSEANG